MHSKCQNKNTKQKIICKSCFISGNVYFTNAGSKFTFLEVMKLNGSSRAVIYSTQVDEPRQLAVNPIKRYMYWLDYGQFPKIVMAMLDATNRTVVAADNVVMPRDITVDILTHDVYWIDTDKEWIQVKLAELPCDFGIYLSDLKLI